MRALYCLSFLLFFSPITHAANPMDICLFTHMPNGSFSSIHDIQYVKLGKGSYGSVISILPKFAQRVDSYGANAVVSYIGSQRFGFWPWRIVRPVVRGQAVNLEMKPGQTCEDLGGATVRDVIASNKAPDRVHLH